MAEANLFQVTSSASMKPETVSDLEGPTRFDPDLGSAPVSVGVPSPADTVGPSSTVMSGRNTTPIGNQPLQLHDSQEVKLTHTQGTTYVSITSSPGSPVRPRTEQRGEKRKRTNVQAAAGTSLVIKKNEISEQNLMQKCPNCIANSKT